MARRHPHDPSYPYITAKHSQAGSHPLAHEYPEFGSASLTPRASSLYVVPHDKTPRVHPCPLLGSILPLLLYAPKTPKTSINLGYSAPIAEYPRFIEVFWCFHPETKPCAGFGFFNEPCGKKKRVVEPPYFFKFEIKYQNPLCFMEFLTYGGGGGLGR